MEEEQTTQWSKFRRYQRVIIIRKWKKNRQHKGQKLGDTKGVIIIRKWKKNRLHNGQNLEDTKG